MTTESLAADELLRLRRAVESTTDLDHVPRPWGRMLFANRAARELIGLGPDEPLPGSRSTSSSARRPSRSRRCAQAIIREGRWSGELFVRGRDRRVPASVVVSGPSRRERPVRVLLGVGAATSVSGADRSGASAAARPCCAPSCSRRRCRSSRSTRDGNGPRLEPASEELFGWRASEVVGGPAVRRVPGRARCADCAGVFEARRFDRSSARYARPRRRPARCARVGRTAAQRFRSRRFGGRRRRRRHRPALRRAALRESEVRFRSLVQNSSDMVTIVDDGRCSTAARAPCVPRHRPRGRRRADVPLDEVCTRKTAP